MKFTKQYIATSIAILFHLVGVIGILFTPYQEWFIQNTPLNLSLMAALLIWTQPNKTNSFFILMGIVFLMGTGTEMIGINTGRLFGSYHYGEVMGKKLNGVPLLIGINWVVVIFSSASVMQQFHRWSRKKLEDTDVDMPNWIANVSLVVDGAILATFFDWLMEPVAMKLGFWNWENEHIPIFNYVCWFLISLFLLSIFRKFRSIQSNQFAVHLFIIQVLFFMTLRIYLS